MKLLAPSTPEEFINRVGWFKKPFARRLLQEKGVEFGFELKGPSEKIVEAPPLFWGVHLPINLASKWYHFPNHREKIFRELERLAKLKPDYAVLHGINLYRQPESKKFPDRYLNSTEPGEYLKILEANIEFISQVKKILPLRIENTLLADFYIENEEYKIAPLTHFHSQVQVLDDLLYISKKTNAEILLDLEHLILTASFLNRQKNYQKLPVNRIENPTSDEKRINEIFGFWLEKDSYPYIDEKIDIDQKIKKYQAKFYHLTGSTQDVIFNKRVLSHGPIELGDMTFRKNLRMILAKKPEVLVLEVANSTVNSAWNWLRPNETEISFENLCQILLEEL